MRSIDSLAPAAVAAPSSAARRTLSAASDVARAVTALAAAARAASCTADRVDSTSLTCRSAPCATSFTAAAMSPTARPASCDVAAICWEAADTVPAFRDTVPISSASDARIAL